MQTAASGAPSLPPHRIRFDLTGDHHAAILLERVQYWTPRTRVRVRGEAWIVKSRADLAQETGLTAEQVRDALARLKRRDILETCQKPFAGKNVTHLRLTPRGTLQMRDAGLLKAGEVGHMAPPEMGQEAQPEMGHVAQLHTQADIDKGVYTSGYIAETSNEVPAIAILPENEITGEEPDMTDTTPKRGALAPTPQPPAPKTGRSAADVLAKLQEKGKGVPPPKKGKKLPLGSVWQDALAKTYPGEFHPTLTMQAQGQLSQLAKKLPGLDVEKVIRSIISDWPSFTEKCAGEAKAFDVPLRPMVGFALKYVAQAANFKAKPAKVQSEAGSKSAAGSFKEVWNG